jgi:hypothetical protein
MGGFPMGHAIFMRCAPDGMHFRNDGVHQADNVAWALATSWSGETGFTM